MRISKVANSLNALSVLSLAIAGDDNRRNIKPNSVPLQQQESDEVLITRLCHGNKEALGCLFRRHSHLIRGIAYRVLQNSVEADDMVQDVFVLIQRLCGTFNSSKASARFWIVQMTYRRAITRRRYLSSRHFYTRVDLDDSAIRMVSSRVGQFANSIEHRLASLDLQRMFANLSENQRQTLRLHFIEGYTLEEIAAMLGQSKGNIRHHSFRGLERLRQQIFVAKPTIPGIRK